MKKILIAAAALLMVASISTSCGKGMGGFKETANGVQYKFHVKTDSKKAQVGDIIVAEIWDYMGGDTVQYTNSGSPSPMFQVNSEDYFSEVLQLMGQGDSVTIGLNMDTMRKFNPALPASENNRWMITIKVEGTYTQAEHEAKIEADRIKGEAEENEKLQAYVKEKNITVKPNEDGVFILVEKQGTGATVTKGKTVSVNYTGTLLNGKVFDSSLESVVKENGLTARPTYEPLAFEVGAGQMIQGMDKSVEGLKVGTKAKLILPSKVAYGSRAMGETIPAFATLIFDIEILSVK